MIATSSLKARLFLILLAATGIIWFAAIAWIYIGAKQEIESVLDSRLQEAARMVSSLGAGKFLDGPNSELDTSTSSHQLTYERQIACQIWSFDGRLMARSQAAPQTSFGDFQEGFSDRLIDGELWRVFGHQDTAKRLRVQVGDRLNIRDHLVRRIVMGLLLPTALIAPLLGFLIWSSLGRGLKPLNEVAEQLRQRRGDDMSPFETGQAPAEMLPIVNAVNVLLTKLESARRHEREISAFAAHELRTPLAGLKTQAQVAMATSDAAARTAALTQIGISVDRATRLVSQLLAIANLDAMNTCHQTSRVNLGDLIDDIMSLQGSEKGRKVEVDPALYWIKITVNEELLILTLRNLYENAVQHSPVDGVVRWVSERRGSVLAVAIEDQGPGIPPDELVLVTKRFYCGRHKTKTGCGLGLAIAEMALKVNSGRLRLSNKADGSGLRAEIILPVGDLEGEGKAQHHDSHMAFKTENNT